MRQFYVFLFALFISGLGFGQTTIYTQDFETDLDGYSHTPSQLPSADPGDQYFHRAEPSDTDIYEGAVGPYTNVTGSWLFVGSNPNTLNSTNPGILSLSPINVSTFSDLEISMDFGAVPDDWDAVDDLRVEYSWDNTTWNLLYNFGHSNGSNDPLTLLNNATGGMNTANGAVLTYALQTIVSNNFVGSGNILYVRIVCDSANNYEAFGVDNIILSGISTGGGCTAPGAQANITAFSSNPNDATISYTTGTGDNVLLLIKEDSAVDTFPSNGTAYAADSNFADGDELGSGNFVAYNVSHNPIGNESLDQVITGLTENTTYHIAIFEYNSVDLCYNLTPATVSFTTPCGTPSETSSFNAISGDTIAQLDWINGECFDELLIVAKEGSAVTNTPSGDGNLYSANASFGTGTDLGSNEFAVYKGTGNSETITNLTNSTTYHFAIFTRLGTSWSTGITVTATPDLVLTTGNLIITEVMQNPAQVSDDFGEYFEVYNPTNTAIDMNGWTISDNGTNTHTINTTVIVPSLGFAVLIRSADININGGINADYEYSNISLQNADDEIILTDGSGTEIERIEYDGGPNWPDPTGSAMIYIGSDIQDNNDGSLWIEASVAEGIDVDFGSPGINGTDQIVNFLIYSGGAWNTAPTTLTNTRNAIIKDGEYSLVSDISVNDFFVDPAAALNITSGSTLTANSLTLESTATAYSSLILDGSLAGNITNNVTYHRFVNNFVAGSGGNDLVASPVTGSTFFDFATDPDNANLYTNPSPANGDEAEYLFGPFDNSNTISYINYSIGLDGSGNPDQSNTNYDNDELLTTGKGFRAATTGGTGSTLTFKGGVNTGNVSTTGFQAPGVAPIDKWNLVGNPYPSYLDAQAFLTTNSGSIDETVLDPNFNAIYGYNDNTDGTTSSRWTIINSLQNNTLNIAPGQGFFVASNNTDELDFTTAMRRSSGGDDFVQGRNDNPVYQTTLKLSKSDDSFNTDFYFTSDASQGLNPGYDAGLFGGTASEFSLYSHLVQENEGVPFAIQALGETDYTNVTIALGVNALQGEQITFSVVFSDLPNNVEVYLEDNVANTNTLLNTNDYVLTPTTNLSGTGRFFLRFTNNVLSISDNPLNNLSIYTDQNDRTVVIAGDLSTATTANIYDIQGRLVISSVLNTNSRSQKINTSNLSSGIYVVQLSDNNNQNISQKIILK